MSLQETRTFSELRRAPIETSGLEPAVGVGDDLEPGTKLGRYVVLCRVGGGGMGTVYAAYDPDLDRKVAVKLLSRGMEPEKAERQTRREAKAMARLAHPNVITVHDVGTYGERVFIAMEYVDGPTLKDWLEAEERSWREIVGAFVQAGHGLSAAHEADLVHLDFKPANVIMTRGGLARVLDFGLARHAAGREDIERAGIGNPSPGAPYLQQSTRWITLRRGSIAGTPAYLAPERLLGQPVDARSDQFSFCVALWEALHGRHPFAAGDRDEYLRLVTIGEIRDSATAHLPSGLRKTLRRGLRADPEERFPTMGELLRALSLARRRTRNRWLVAASALLASGALGIGYLRSTADRIPICGGAESKLQGIWDAERKEAVRAGFFDDGLEFAGDAYRGVERVLDAYTQDWARMHHQACAATHLRGEQSDRMLDLRMLCLDGRLEEVRALTEVLSDADAEVIARSVEAARKLSSLAPCADRLELTSHMLPPRDPEIRRAVVRIRAAVEAQYALKKTRKRVEIPSLERSVEDARRIGFAPLEARALALLAEERLYVAGDTAGAEEAFHQALLAATASGDRPLQAALYASLVRTVGYFQRRHDEARRWKAFAEAILPTLGSGHGDVEVHVKNALSVFAWSTGEIEEAKGLGLEALATGERTWGVEDPRLGNVLNNIAIPINNREHAQEAIGHLERALALVEKGYGRWNPIYMGPTLTNLSVAYVNADRYEDALRVASRCLEIIDEFYGEHRDLTYPLINVAHILNYHFDRPVEAEQHLRRALPLARSGFGEEHPLVGHLLASLGDVALRQLRLDEAEAYLRHGARIREAQLSPKHHAHAETQHSFGRLFLAKGSHAEALVHLERALSLMDEDSSFDDPTSVALLIALGEAHLGLRRPEVARSFLEKALDEGRADRYPGLGSEARFALARTLGHDQPERARELAAGALEALAGDSPMTRKLRARLESWLTAQARS